MEHTCVEPLRPRDRRLGSPRHARPDGPVDFVLHRRDGAFAHLMGQQPRTLLDQRITADPFALDHRLVAIAPMPILTGTDMLEIAAALDAEERRPAFPMRLLDGGTRQRIDTFNVAAVVSIAVAAERLHRLGQGSSHLARLARRVDRVAVVLAYEHHGQAIERGGVEALPEHAGVHRAIAEECDGGAPRSQLTVGKGSTYCDRDLRRHYATRQHVPLIRSGKMHGAA